MSNRFVQEFPEEYLQELDKQCAVGLASFDIHERSFDIVTENGNDYDDGTAVDDITIEAEAALVFAYIVRLIDEQNIPAGLEQLHFFERYDRAYSAYCREGHPASPFFDVTNLERLVSA
ncbi:MAG: hypothetical protein MJZ01_05020 [Bacteroidales bacterium]|nr:hypothetical protein [Bacteroidales bacterium]